MVREVMSIAANVIYGQDGGPVNALVARRFDLEKGDVRYVKAERQEVYDFVGFALGDEEILAVFPKHFFTLEELQDRNGAPERGQEDLRLLFAVLCKYMEEENTAARAERYLGEAQEYQSDYPFAPFFQVYAFYRKYGIYLENNAVVRPGTVGRVAWKQTIQRAQTIVSGGNLLYSPLYMKTNDYRHVFLSDCMAFVIDHTIGSFPYFLALPRTGYRRTNLNYLENVEYTLRQLRFLQTRMFKDIHKNLVGQLIAFFEQYKNRPVGGKLHIKIAYFDRIWERMTERYLNRHFVGVDEAAGCLIFDPAQQRSPVHFSARTFSFDESPHGYEIVPDHYAEDETAQYIFDSKYYNAVNEFNYKQFTYNELLRHYAGRSRKTYNALILPGRKDNGLHLRLAAPFAGGRTSGDTIIEQYVDVREMMQSYVSE